MGMDNYLTQELVVFTSGNSAHHFPGVNLRDDGFDRAPIVQTIHVYKQ